MNKGGFSWKRLVGISAFKSKVSRTIGIPLTAGGRRRKLGASVFNAVGPVVGTLAVAAVAAKKSQQSESQSTPQETSSRKGVHFCLVKGVTHNSADGTSHAANQQLCSIGDIVQLVPEPSNVHDRNAIRVVLRTGQQIGYISATQAARFAGKVHELIATVHSRVADDWGNETIKLRVVNSHEHPPCKVDSAIANPQSSFDDKVMAIQVDARETAKKEGWQFTVVYFDSADGRLYQICPAEDAQGIRQSLEKEGMTYVGFIGGKDAPKGIQFGFSLDDSFPMDGIVAKRFLVNAREWVTTRSKDLCKQKGIAAPIVHNFEPSSRFASANQNHMQNAPASRSTLSPATFGAVVGIAGFCLGLFTQQWRISLLIVLFVLFCYGGAQGLLKRLAIFLIISCLIYQAWWATGLLTVLTAGFLVFRQHGTQHPATN